MGADPTRALREHVDPLASEYGPGLYVSVRYDAQRDVGMAVCGLARSMFDGDTTVTSIHNSFTVAARALSVRQTNRGAAGLGLEPLFVPEHQLMRYDIVTSEVELAQATLLLDREAYSRLRVGSKEYACEHVTVTEVVSVPSIQELRSMRRRDTRTGVGYRMRFELYTEPDGFPRDGNARNSGFHQLARVLKRKWGATKARSVHLNLATLLERAIAENWSRDEVIVVLPSGEVFSHSPIRTLYRIEAQARAVIDEHESIWDEFVDCSMNGLLYCRRCKRPRRCYMDNSIESGVRCVCGGIRPSWHLGYQWSVWSTLTREVVASLQVTSHLTQKLSVVSRSSGVASAVRITTRSMSMRTTPQQASMQYEFDVDPITLLDLAKAVAMDVRARVPEELHHCVMGVVPVHIDHPNEGWELSCNVRASEGHSEVRNSQPGPAVAVYLSYRLSAIEQHIPTRIAIPGRNGSVVQVVLYDMSRIWAGIDPASLLLDSATDGVHDLMRTIDESYGDLLSIPGVVMVQPSCIRFKGKFQEQSIPELCVAVHVRHKGVRWANSRIPPTVCSRSTRRQFSVDIRQYNMRALGNGSEHLSESHSGAVFPGIRICIAAPPLQHPTVQQTAGLVFLYHDDGNRDRKCVLTSAHGIVMACLHALGRLPVLRSHRIQMYDLGIIRLLQTDQNLVRVLNSMQVSVYVMTDRNNRKLIGTCHVGTALSFFGLVGMPRGDRSNYADVAIVSISDDVEVLAHPPPGANMAGLADAYNEFRGDRQHAFPFGPLSAVSAAIAVHETELQEHARRKRTLAATSVTTTHEGGSASSSTQPGIPDCIGYKVGATTGLTSGHLRGVTTYMRVGDLWPEGGCLEGMTDLHIIGPIVFGCMTHNGVNVAGDPVTLPGDSGAPIVACVEDADIVRGILAGSDGSGTVTIFCDIMTCLAHLRIDRKRIKVPGAGLPTLQPADAAPAAAVATAYQRSPEQHATDDMDEDSPLYAQQRHAP